MGEELDTDKAVEAPETTGQADAPPEAQRAEDMLSEAIDEETVAAAEGTEDEGAETGETEVVEGADSTAMAAVADPVLDMLKADPRFAGSTFNTKEEFLDSVQNIRTRLSQREEDAVLGREARGDWDDFKKFQASRQTEERQKNEFSPPPMPVGWDIESQKPEAERDQVKVQQYNDRTRSIQDWATNVFTDPQEHLMNRMVLPQVVNVVHEILAAKARETEVRTYVEERADYVNAHGREIESLMTSEQIPLKIAIELHQGRNKSKSTTAAKARDADATTEAKKRAGPTHVASPTKAAADAGENLNDLTAIAREAAGIGPLSD